MAIILRVFSFWLIGLMIILFISGDRQSLNRWDSGHFLGIAENGYRFEFQYAFFPLFPLLINAFSNIFNIPFIFSGVLVNFSSTILIIFFLYKLLEKEFKKEIAIKSVVAFLLFPASFFLLTPYSESVFILFVILSSLFLQRKKYLFVSIFVILACLTRLAGVALIPAVLLEVYLIKKKTKDMYFLLLLPLGLLIYVSYLYINTGHPFYFLEAEKYWKRDLTIPGAGIVITIEEFIKTQEFQKLIDLLFTIFGIGLVLRSIKFLKPSFAMYGVISLLLPLFTPTLSSMPRFLLPIFPIFILIGLIKNKYIYTIYIFISTILMVYFAATFFSGGWVA